MHADPSFKKALKGKTVLHVVAVDVGDDETWPGIQFTDGSILTIQRDPEGNGPGFATLEDKDGNNLGAMG
jgi:hypothetical protein